MKALVHRLKMLKAFGALVKDPTRTECVFEIEENGRALKGPLVDEIIGRLSETEGLRELYESRYRPTLPPLKELITYPENTFGYAFARHMLDNRLEVNFFPIPDGREPLETYLVERGRKSHDFWHVLTGFDTSVASEIGVQGFTLAQLRAPISGLIIAAGLLHSITRDQTIFYDLIEKLFAGYQMGKSARPLMGQPIETWLSEDLNQLRLRLGVVPWRAKGA